MGMFSWKCKGCGHELIERESVRLNGQVQEYDGYGGSAANNLLLNAYFHRLGDYDPSAWHNRCYKKASRPHQLEESASSHAPNQGFGPSKLEFLSGYDETVSVDEFTVVVNGYYSSDNGDSRQFDYHLTNNGKLEDQREYYQRYEAAAEVHEFDYDAWKEMSDAEKEAQHQQRKVELETALGSAMPQTNAKAFASLQEAIDAVDAVLPELPAELNGEYDLTIYGKQGNIEGAVYQRSVSRKYDRTGEKWVKLDVLEVEESYRLGLDKAGLVEEQLDLVIARFNEAQQALNDASEALGRAVQPFVNTDDTDKLHELADRLPKAWSGVRRIYEKLIGLENANWMHRLMPQEPTEVFDSVRSETLNETERK